MYAASPIRRKDSRSSPDGAHLRYVSPPGITFATLAARPFCTMKLAAVQHWLID